MSIPAFDQSVKFSLGNFDLSVEAQGTLLSVRLINNLKGQTKRSVADDADEEWARTREAIQSLVKQGATELDQHLVTFERQVLSAAKTHAVRGWRSPIIQFSKKSRLRLLRVCSKLDLALYGLFMTFTYRQNLTDARTAKEHLEKLSLWLKRNYPQTAFIWRMEFQERGAIHFHIIALNRAFIPAKKLTDYWQKITGDDSYPDIKRLRSRKRVMYYLSKYIAKVTQTAINVDDGVTGNQQEELARLDERIKEIDAGKSVGLVSVPYSDNFIGRYWGVINRKKLPLAPLKAVVVHDLTEKVFFRFKRYARRYWKFLSRRLQNFYLFVDNADRWLELLNLVILS